jgi:hypothetical protein
VIREDDGLVCGKKGVEVAVREAVGILFRRLEPHEVDHVDDPHFQIRGMLAQEADRR